MNIKIEITLDVVEIGGLLNDSTRTSILVIITTSVRKIKNYLKKGRQHLIFFIKILLLSKFFIRIKICQTRSKNCTG